MDSDSWRITIACVYIIMMRLIIHKHRENSSASSGKPITKTRYVAIVDQNLTQAPVRVSV